MSHVRAMVAILPCNDLDVSEGFYRKLGFTHRSGPGDYRMLSDDQGREIHLTEAAEGWLIPGRNPFGLYLYAENVDELAERMGELVLRPPEDKPWGTYEFALSDPDETLVRVRLADKATSTGANIGDHVGGRPAYFARTRRAPNLALPRSRRLWNTA